MTQIDPYRYSVDAGEKITIVITPLDGALASGVTASLDGESLVNEGLNSEPMFNFEATKASGKRHLVVVTYHFVPGVPGGARYDVIFKSSMGDEHEGDPVVNDDEADDDVQPVIYKFKVT